MAPFRTVGDIGERTLLAGFARAAAASGPGVLIGPGDDAAVIEPGATVLSVDTAVQGRHFRLDWSAPEQIGARAVIAAAADIAAMGGTTTGVLVSLAAPADSSAEVLIGINAGVVNRAAAIGAAVLGGDLVEASEISVSITAVGVLDAGGPIRLGGARAGDVLAVSGPLGASAAGHALLAAGGVAPDGDPQGRAVVDAFRCPAPDLQQGPAAARGGAHGLTDISDGLVEELALMAAASGVALDVDSAAIPVTDAVAAVAQRLGVDVRRWSLGGGEDHELLGAFGAAAQVPPGWWVIGAVVGSREEAVHIDGAPTRLHGWRSV
ncbi:thiamine-phosphate kinase [Gordonia defluvii]|uniref:Thiamine-monophosphate kinase n=1 Tax=Gordonia defluvii TaxID=283718 RepID=A0ABP6LCL7_9ACTN|nr:thiamine-phosphate kinase [Gordonia sp. UBA5067]